MGQIIIKGGRPLKGTVRVGGAKNAGFKLMVASLLSFGESEFLDVPRISDVEITKEVIKALGGRAERQERGTVITNSDLLKESKIPKEFGSKSRASIMFAAPLLARFGKAEIPLPGGDKVGRRPIERHLEGLRSLGVKVELTNNLIHLNCLKLVGNHYRFAKNTHTGTETMIMAAVKAQGRTVLENAALEPEIDDLINYLNKMGGKIRRLPGRKIRIDGVQSLKGTIYKVMPDRNEAVSYACCVLGTKGDVIIENAPTRYLSAFLRKVKEAGAGYEIGNYGIRFWRQVPLRAASITTQPYPGFMTDWQPLWTTLMTQAKGQSRIIETVHDSRFGFIKDLNKMGAGIKIFNPKISHPEKFYNFNLKDDRPDNIHAVKVIGPTFLRGQRLTVTDVRSGATLALAALMARGQSILTGIEHIDRGYEDLEGKLKKLGAEIKRVS